MMRNTGHYIINTSKFKRAGMNCPNNYTENRHSTEKKKTLTKNPPSKMRTIMKA